MKPVNLRKKIELFKWSMRKLTLPIYGSGLNLDVGSGGNPHPFADVLLEKYLDDTHRLKAIKIDRPTVLADASKMPFKDKAFEFVFAFHVLEHLHQPAEFLDEVQRIGKSGYIETPNALYERIHPFSVHLLEILHVEGTLYIYKKRGPRGDDFIGQINLLERDAAWRDFFYSNPRLFHNCYRWNGEIKYKILNPDVDTNWFEDPETASTDGHISASLESSFRARFIELLKKFNTKKVDLDSILACPECKGDLVREPEHYRCANGHCGLRYKRNPVPDFNNPV